MGITFLSSQPPRLGHKWGNDADSGFTNDGLSHGMA